VRELYGVSNIFGLFPARITYVIAEEGVVRPVFSSQLGISEHVEEALGAFRAIKAKARGSGRPRAGTGGEHLIE
jgi:thioredoxin-dependent peroxiredoxin